jgi:glucokinase
VIAGIDLGGTQVRVALARSDGRITATARARTPLLKTPERVVEWAAAQIEKHSGREKVRSLAIGAPGPIDTRRGVLVNPPNLPGWRNVPLTALLEQAVGCPAYLENDANLAGLGEYHQGAGRGAVNLVYVTWSTGVGGALILGGRLYSGSHGSAGEIGHTVVDPDGPLDGCGQRGCIEVFCGGRQLAAQTGESTSELFEAASKGDLEARMIVNRAATYMGIGLINLTNLVDPDVIVMGGGITRSWKVVEPVLTATLRGSPFIKPNRRPRLRRARLGDRGGLVGAVEWARHNL